MIFYPVRYAGSFSCSDPLLERIWYTGAYTVHLCMQDEVWDAPKRDRLPWMGDLHPEARVIHYVFADKLLLRHTMDRLLRDAQAPTGDRLVRHINGIPGYSCAWVLGLAEDYRFSGDFDYLKSRRDGLVQVLDYLRSETDGRGLFANRNGEWPFVDWAPALGGGSATADQLVATHLFLCAALREAVWMLRALGDPETARFEAWQRQAVAAAHDYLLDQAACTFGPRRQVNAMAVFSGVAVPEEIGRIYHTVLGQAVPEGDRVTPYYNFYVCEAMAAAGRYQETLDFIRGYWGAMLARGATTWWEVFDPRDAPTAEVPLGGPDWHGGMGYGTSLSHGWGSGPTDWLSHYVLGVWPSSPGFSTAEIVPHLGDLGWAQGTVPTPRGLIRVRHERGSNGLRSWVRLPQGITARVGLARGQAARGVVVLNGSTVAPESADQESVYVRLQGPGRYRLEVR